MKKIGSYRLNPLALALASKLTFLGLAPHAMAEVNIVEPSREIFPRSPLEFELFDPKRIRPIINQQTHVRICLMHTDVAIGCDVPPNGTLDLTFPIIGRFTLKGKYMLAAQDDDRAAIPGATEVLLWKQVGDGPAIEKGKLRARPGEQERNFQDDIVTSYTSVDDELYTVLSFNVPREEGYFGPAIDYQDSSGSFVESDDNKLNWSISIQLFKDESIDPPVCEFLKMIYGSDDCLVPQNLELSSSNTGIYSSYPILELPKLSFVY